MKELKILLLVDAQICFESGCLGSAYAQEIVPYICRKIKEKKEEGYFCILTEDTHGKNYLNTREGRILSVVHGVPGEESTGWEIIPAIRESACETGDFCFLQKADFGTFDIPDTISEFIGPDAHEPDGAGMTIYIMGYCTDVCVITNAIILRQQFPEATIIVDSQGCAGVTRERHMAALEVMRSCQITVV